MTAPSTPADRRDPAIVLETERLILRRFSLEDAAFILELVNQPSFLQYIGDKGVRNLEDARGYLLSGPLASYERFGFGLFLTLRKADGVPVGMCGLLKRESLPDADIGFAFLPQFWRQGYGYEAATAVLEYGRRVHGLTRLLAITSVDNHASIALLERLGLSDAGLVRLSDPGEEVRLMAREL